MLIGLLGSTGSRSSTFGSSTTNEMKKKTRNNDIGSWLFGRRQVAMDKDQVSTIPRNTKKTTSVSVTTTEQKQLTVSSDASHRSVLSSPTPHVHFDIDNSDNDVYDERVTDPESTPGKVHNDRSLHSIGCFGRQFVNDVLKRLYTSPATEKYGISRSNVHCIGMILRNVCEWELPFELSEDSYLDDEISAWRMHSRVDPLWAGIEHSLHRWCADDNVSNGALDGTMTMALVKKCVFGTLWDMGIHSLRFRIGHDDDESTWGDNPPCKNGWTMFGCCQCTPFEPL